MPHNTPEDKIPKRGAVMSIGMILLTVLALLILLPIALIALLVWYFIRSRASR